jgi:hypothetical protein
VLEREGSGKGNIGGKEREESTVPKRPVIWDLRPFMGSMEKIVKISEDTEIKIALWRPF